QLLSVHLNYPGVGNWPIGLRASPCLLFGDNKSARSVFWFDFKSLFDFLRIRKSNSGPSILFLLK
ncbi:hypothetical protein MKX03_004606, partial [Papaver bracteatum]